MTQKEKLEFEDLKKVKLLYFQNWKKYETLYNGLVNEKKKVNTNLEKKLKRLEKDSVEYFQNWKKYEKLYKSLKLEYDLLKTKNTKQYISQINEQESRIRQILVEYYRMADINNEYWRRYGNLDV